MAGEMRIEKVQVQIELRLKVASSFVEVQDGAILWQEEIRSSECWESEFWLVKENCISIAKAESREPSSCAIAIPSAIFHQTSASHRYRTNSFTLEAQSLLGYKSPAVV